MKRLIYQKIEHFLNRAFSGAYLLERKNACAFFLLPFKRYIMAIPINLDNVTKMEMVFGNCYLQRSKIAKYISKI